MYLTTPYGVMSSAHRDIINLAQTVSVYSTLSASAQSSGQQILEQLSNMLPSACSVISQSNPMFPTPKPLLLFSHPVTSDCLAPWTPAHQTSCSSPLPVTPKLYAHCFGDAIQPCSHPPDAFFSSCPQSFQSQGLSNELQFQHQPSVNVKPGCFS